MANIISITRKLHRPPAKAEKQRKKPAERNRHAVRRSDGQSNDSRRDPVSGQLSFISTTEAMMNPALPAASGRQYNEILTVGDREYACRVVDSSISPSKPGAPGLQYRVVIDTPADPDLAAIREAVYRDRVWQVICREQFSKGRFVRLTLRHTEHGDSGP